MREIYKGTISVCKARWTEMISKKMGTIDSELVVKTISHLMFVDLTAIAYGRKSASDEPQEEESEEVAVHIVRAEESILTLMKVAHELGVYDEVLQRVEIPQRLKEEYWGPDHPNA